MQIERRENAPPSTDGAKLLGDRRPFLEESFDKRQTSETKKEREGERQEARERDADEHPVIQRTCFRIPDPRLTRRRCEGETHAGLRTYVTHGVTFAVRLDVVGRRYAARTEGSSLRPRSAMFGSLRAAASPRDSTTGTSDGARV